MKEFYEMLRRVTSSPHHNRMMRYVRPLKEHFGVNHFWYYRVLDSGYYSYLGSHSAWNEYCFENHLIDQFPILRHPMTQKEGIHLMKKTANGEYSNVQREAWDNFQINFNINIAKKIAGGIEAYGFATESNHPEIDEHLLNEISLLSYFIKSFRKQHWQLFELILDNQVDITPYFGKKFYKKESDISCAKQREEFLKEMEWLPVNGLTPREKEVLLLLSQGYPSSFIATALSLSKKTIENYTATIKCKLFCSSKVALIKKATELKSIGHL